MRSLGTAVRMGVLVTLTGAAPGCGYPNPGFKLKDSDPVTSTDEQTTNVSGVTTVPTEPTAPTTSTTSTTDAMTTQGPGVSGSETSTTDVDPTITGPDASTGDLPPWDASCHIDDRVPADPVPAAADGFFLLQGEGIGDMNCDIELGQYDGTTQCIDRNTGAVTYMPLVNFPSGPTPADDLLNVFGVRFDVPVIEHDGDVVPMEAFAAGEISVTVFRGTNKLPTLDVYPMGPGTAWPEADNMDPNPCMEDQPTYRCRACSDKPTACKEAWKYGAVFNPNVPDGALIATMTTKVEQNMLGVATVKLDTVAHLKRAFEGVVVVARPDLRAPDTFEVKTLNSAEDFANGPFLTISFCPKPLPP